MLAQPRSLGGEGSSLCVHLVPEVLIAPQSPHLRASRELSLLRKGDSQASREKSQLRGGLDSSSLWLSKHLLEKWTILQMLQITTELEERKQLEGESKGNRVLLRKDSCRPWVWDWGSNRVGNSAKLERTGTVSAGNSTQGTV